MKKIFLILIISLILFWNFIMFLLLTKEKVILEDKVYYLIMNIVGTLIGSAITAFISLKIVNKNIESNKEGLRLEYNLKKSEKKNELYREKLELLSEKIEKII